MPTISLSFWERNRPILFHPQSRCFIRQSQDQLKQHAAQAALSYIAPKLERKSVVGVGTGSTANYFIDELAKIKHTFDAAVASSEETQRRLTAHGITVVDLNAAPQLDVYVDGADEIDKSCSMIKAEAQPSPEKKSWHPLPTNSSASPTVVSWSINLALCRLGRPSHLVEVMATSFWTHGTIGQPRRINDIAGVVCNGIATSRQR